MVIHSPRITSIRERGWASTASKEGLSQSLQKWNVGRNERKKTPAAEKAEIATMSSEASSRCGEAGADGNSDRMAGEFTPHALRAFPILGMGSERVGCAGLRIRQPLARGGGISSEAAWCHPRACRVRRAGAALSGTGTWRR